MTAKACLHLLDHCPFIGSEKDSPCFQDELRSLLQVSTKQVFSPDFDVDGSQKVVKSNTEFLKEIAIPLSKKIIDNWTVTPRTVLLRMFPLHIVHFLGNANKDASFSKTCRYIALSQCSEKWCE